MENLGMVGVLYDDKDPKILFLNIVDINDAYKVKRKLGKAKGSVLKVIDILENMGYVVLVDSRFFDFKFKPPNVPDGYV